MTTLFAGRPGRVAAAGLALGYLADQLLGDPRRGHPVAGFGRLAGWLEGRTYGDRRSAGIVHVAALVGPTVALGALLEHRAPGRLILTAAATWTVLGGRSLTREASILAGQLASGQLAAARVQVRNLVGRRTEDLSSGEIARATVESLAENTSDAVVAPLFWGAVAGIPGLLGYRAVNTLDAMIGHRSDRYRQFGWAAARLDDVANWLPARLAGAITAAVAPLVGGSAADVVRIVRRDAGQHPSPNAGVVESAFAAALRITLGGTNTYGAQIEERGRLGDGKSATAADIEPAVRLARLVCLGALVTAVIIRGARA